MTSTETQEDRIEYRDENKILASSPCSSTSGCHSGDESQSGEEERRGIPSALVEDELRLALNKEATAEELEQAIARCRELVLESEQCSLERKWLVRHLVELRLRLQECCDALTDPSHPHNKGSSVSRRVVLGHHLVLQPFLSMGAVSGARKLHCDHCAATIWSMLQAWYRCEDCGYSCHHKCIPGIVRVCAHLTATERGNYIMDICPERGLSAQKYRCSECGTPLTFTMPRGITCFGRYLLSAGSSWAEARLCDYDGRYYCTGCHWNSQAVIPARVVHNWDLEKRAVCQASAQLLRITARQPLIHLERLNPKLFAFVPELGLVRRLREELAVMRRYVSACRVAQEHRLVWRAADRQHLLNSTHMYSLQDLLEVHTGELPTFLQALADTFTQHIKHDCAVCTGRGHLCEICGNDEVFFPFEAGTVTCDSCAAVFHRACFTRKREMCPKCVRIRLKTQQEIQLTND